MVTHECCEAPVLRYQTSCLELEPLGPQAAALATMKACSSSDIESLVMVEMAVVVR